MASNDDYANPKLPSEYRRAVFKTKGEPLVFETVALVLPKPGEMLVKVEACGVCHSDTFARDDSFGGGLPRVPGHEIIGRIVALAEGDQEWKVGERIGGAWHGYHDNTCRSCKMGLFQMCDNEKINGITMDGGYQEYCLLSTVAVVRVAEHLPAAEYAPVLCAGITTFNSLRKMQLTPGSLVAIQGLGGLGHLALQYAAKSGYRVVALSRDDRKEAFARQLGAVEYIHGSPQQQAEALAKLGGAACIMCTAPSQDSIGPLVFGVGPLGKILILSVAGDVPVNTGKMIGYGISVQAWPSGSNIDLEDTLHFTELQNIKPMVQSYPFEKAQDAFNAMEDGSVRFRAVITFP